jgi:hypothetical protein
VLLLLVLALSVINGDGYSIACSRLARRLK